ncbi:MAG: NTP transferase domain-containing protein [Oligoflexia bacterium]|nr:NTP transferase domain-containing protein [Oligoflexia bacterium]
MKHSMPLGILGAGLGSRMKEKGHSKPLVKIQGKTILEHSLLNFSIAGFHSITCALRLELLSNDDKANLPQLPYLEYLFVNTPSSLHTLFELNKKIPENQSAAFAMVDTVLFRKDLQEFASFCSNLGENESALLVTPHIDDEKPLWVHIDDKKMVTKISSTEPSTLVTSGIYYLSRAARSKIAPLIDQGVERMRNYLKSLVDDNQAVKVFVVEKTIDVDHPSDLIHAENIILRNIRGPLE